MSGAGVDASWREVDLSHLPESPLDPSEQADGDNEFFMEGDYFLLHYYVLNVNHVKRNK